MPDKGVLQSVMKSVLSFCTPTPKVKVEKITEEQPKSFNADSRLWRARKGEFNSYKVYLEPGEKVIFNIWSFIHRDTGRRFIQVFPISYYKDDKLVMRVRRIKNGKQPFLSGGVLFNRFDVDLIPAKYRGELEQWALLIMDGVRRYDEKIRETRLLRQ